MNDSPKIREKRSVTSKLLLHSLLLAGGWLFQPLCFSQSPADVEELVFALRQPGKDPHYYANFGYFAVDSEQKLYGEGARLCRLNLRTAQVLVLLDDSRGGIRDPQVHYDGKTILFSYRKGETPNYLLYTIKSDGSGLRQITDGPFDDIEPAWMPDETIVFCSSRCRRWVNCWPTQVAVLHRCNADGKNMRMLSSNNQHDNTPWMLPDGRMLYTRWEYVDRSEVDYHHLWTANPDGTAQMIYFGNMHPGIAMLDAKPIPGTGLVLASFSPGHGQREHEGYVTIVDPGAGPDARPFARRVSQTPEFRDPYPLSETQFLAATRSSLVLMDRKGATRVIYVLPEAEQRAGFECSEPRPLRERPREPVIPDRSVPAKSIGTLVLSDIHLGRNMDGVKRGEIKELLILETLPKPINFTGSGDPVSYNGTFTLERIAGTVPVEPDGSAYFELPAMRSFFFVALDAQGLAVKRMQSFLTVQPGESVGCVGCHEHRASTRLPGAPLQALHRPPSQVQPIPGVPDVFDFPRDIQPILDRHCLKCHDYDRREGGVILSGDRGPFFSHSFWMLTVREQFSDGRNRPRSNYAPRTIGSSASPLIQKIDNHHSEVTLSPAERNMVRLWIDSGAPYAGTYAALGTGMLGAYRKDILDRGDAQWPAMQAAQRVLGKRCGSCHTGDKKLPASPSDDLGMPPWQSKFGDPRTRFSRHILYNLTRPEKSLLLLSPLAKEAGGYGTCTGTKPPAVFTTKNDPDYQVLHRSVLAAKEYLERNKRFDMPGFYPGPEYTRELIRYGILPPSHKRETPFDVYATDRAYWESHWYTP